MFVDAPASRYSSKGCPPKWGTFSCFTLRNTAPDHGRPVVTRRLNPRAEPAVRTMQMVTVLPSDYM